ncbi:neurofilament medium polypeptide-like protein [Lasius niger]|uniref:Neurofilament medium polypeptide-like protein n=1 Tax=Lasius niger TaxID=67767 RepID=A0A0J7JZ55_LASNI|nr:neurofilament medium polypeptide-like protein [Lasius niger]
MADSKQREEMLERDKRNDKDGRMEGALYEVARGVEGKVVKGGERRNLGEEDGEIGKGEIKRVIERLKNGKASEADGVPNEVWKLGGERIEDWAWRFCNRVWRGKGGRSNGRMG